MNYIVLGDVHGNVDALQKTLEEIGVVNGKSRTPDWHIIQVGDLLNMAPEGVPYRGFVSQDKKTLEYADGLIDEILVGNHELYIARFIGAPSYWDGMGTLQNLDSRLVEHIEDLVDRGQYQVSTVVDDALISHAGISWYREWMGTAQEVSEGLNTMLAHHTENDSLEVDGRFREILGANGPNWESLRSVFWSRPDVWEGPAPFLQIVGHTPNVKGPYFDERLNTWFVDNAGYIATTYKFHPNYYIGDYIPALIKREGENWVPWTSPIS